MGFRLCTNKGNYALKAFLSVPLFFLTTNVYADLQTRSSLFQNRARKSIRAKGVLSPAEGGPYDDTKILTPEQAGLATVKNDVKELKLQDQWKKNGYDACSKDAMSDSCKNPMDDQAPKVKDAEIPYGDPMSMKEAQLLNEIRQVTQAQDKLAAVISNQYDTVLKKQQAIQEALQQSSPQVMADMKSKQTKWSSDMRSTSQNEVDALAAYLSNLIVSFSDIASKTAEDRKKVINLGLDTLFKNFETTLKDIVKQEDAIVEDQKSRENQLNDVIAKDRDLANLASAASGEAIKALSDSVTSSKRRGDSDRTTLMNNLKQTFVETSRTSVDQAKTLFSRNSDELAGDLNKAYSDIQTAIKQAKDNAETSSKDDLQLWDKSLRDVNASLSSFAKDALAKATSTLAEADGIIGSLKDVQNTKAQQVLSEISDFVKEANYRSDDLSQKQTALEASYKAAKDKFDATKAQKEKDWTSKYNDFVNNATADISNINNQTQFTEKQREATLLKTADSLAENIEYYRQEIELQVRKQAKDYARAQAQAEQAKNLGSLLVNAEYQSQDSSLRNFQQQGQQAVNEAVSVGNEASSMANKAMQDVQGQISQQLSNTRSDVGGQFLDARMQVMAWQKEQQASQTKSLTNQDEQMRSLQSAASALAASGDSAVSEALTSKELSDKMDDRTQAFADNVKSMIDRTKSDINAAVDGFGPKFSLDVNSSLTSLQSSLSRSGAAAKDALNARMQKILAERSTTVDKVDNLMQDHTAIVNNQSFNLEQTVKQLQEMENNNKHTFDSFESLWRSRANVNQLKFAAIVDKLVKDETNATDDKVAAVTQRVLQYLSGIVGPVTASSAGSLQRLQELDSRADALITKILEIRKNMNISLADQNLQIGELETNFTNMKNDLTGWKLESKLFGQDMVNRLRDFKQTVYDRSHSVSDTVQSKLSQVPVAAQELDKKSEAAMQSNQQAVQGYIGKFGGSVSMARSAFDSFVANESSRRERTLDMLENVNDESQTAFMERVAKLRQDSVSRLQRLSNILNGLSDVASFLQSRGVAGAGELKAAITSLGFDNQEQINMINKMSDSQFQQSALHGQASGSAAKFALDQKRIDADQTAASVGSSLTKALESIRNGEAVVTDSVASGKADVYSLAELVRSLGSDASIAVSRASHSVGDKQDALKQAFEKSQKVQVDKISTVGDVVSTFVSVVQGFLAETRLGFADMNSTVSGFRTNMYKQLDDASKSMTVVARTIENAATRLMFMKQNFTDWKERSSEDTRQKLNVLADRLAALDQVHETELQGIVSRVNDFEKLTQSKLTEYEDAMNSDFEKAKTTVSSEISRFRKAYEDSVAKRQQGS